MATYRLRLALAVLATYGVATARADVTGSYDGNITAKAAPQPISVAATLTQVGKTLTGTVALAGDVVTFGGEYLVQGKATPKRIKLSGGGGHGGAFFKWQAKIVGGTLKGRARVKAPGAKLNGLLVLTLNGAIADGSSCDGVYQANQTFFTGQVLGQALTICATCHAPGLQAASTRFQVSSGDPLATARSVAKFVDSANPAGSRVLMKPLNLVPHGGGVQLEAGTAPEPILEQWIGLVAQAHCN